MQGQLEGRRSALEKRLRETAEKPGAETAGLAVAVVEGDRVSFLFRHGRRFIDGGDPSMDLPSEADAKFRVASISKPVAGIAAMILAELGELDPERDVSAYLGFTLRNPAFPDIPITASMLLSHTSSLRDGESYSLPLGRGMEEFFEPGGANYEDGDHFAAEEPGKDLSPGRYFAYCNLGFGIMGTIIERLSGMRYDLFARRHVLEPLAMDASFNVNLLDDEAFGKLGVLYRKAKDGRRDPDGGWVPQIDDYRGKRPAMPCACLPGLGPGDLERYVPGTNGTLFSPQGGLRASVLDLAKMARLFINGGEVNGTRILSQDSVDAMMETRWTLDPSAGNGDSWMGLTRSTGLALIRNTGSFDASGGDRLMETGSPPLWGHHGDAYGLLGGMMFHPGSRYGFAYLMNGTAADPATMRGRHSSFFLWEEEIQESILEFLGEKP